MSLNFRNRNKKDNRNKKKNSQYCFVDEIGIEQGPFFSNEIVNWIRTGYFDGKGDLLFRNLTSSPAERLTLEQILPELLNEVESNFSERLSPKKTSIIKENNYKPIEVKEITLVDDQIPLLEENDDQHKDLIMIVKPSAKATEIQEQMLKTRSNLSALFIDKTDTLNSKLIRNKIELNNEKDEPSSYFEKYLEQFYVAQEFDHDSFIFSPVLKINVHSSILATSSPLLKKSMKTLFEEHFRLRERVSIGNCTDEEREQSLVNPVLIIESDCPIAIQAIVRYLYGHTSEILSMNKLLLVSMWKESKRFMWKKLEDELLLNLFSSKLNIIDLVEIAAAAAIIKLPKLVDEIVTMIASCASYILQGPYLALNVDAYLKLLSSNYVMMDELQLFFATQQFIQQKEKEIGIWAESNLDSKFDKEIIIYKSIKYDQMSPEELNLIRTTKLDSLILDAALNKLTGTEMEGRLRPWLPNSEYKVKYRDGEYPVTLIKLGSPNKSESNLLQTRWAWTIGDSRLISEMTFAFQVSKSSRGKLRVGICCTGKPVITETQNIRMSKVFYYDFFEKEFASAFLGSNVFQCTSRIKSSDVRKCNIKFNSLKSLNINHFKNAYNIINGTKNLTEALLNNSVENDEDIFVGRVKNGQIYHLVVSIHDYSITMKIENIETGAYIENYYNHGFLVDRLEVSRKPYIETKIFIEMLDPGDSLTIPSFLSTARNRRIARSN
ncbi:hypothetical protein FG386_002950 [Cryptosporidium ryanae]|uniref:uncharacterized protein n=1 Tax=Cryptosporidium ryanae TaxID=515981 RepID=UPI00351A0FE3|nr:hypothetical protein FG386_002950 [Cryptosporidium ryanae]